VYLPYRWLAKQFRVKRVKCIYILRYVSWGGGPSVAVCDKGGGLKLAYFALRNMWTTPHQITDCKKSSKSHAHWKISQPYTVNTLYTHGTSTVGGKQRYELPFEISRHRKSSLRTTVRTDFPRVHWQSPWHRISAILAYNILRGCLRQENRNAINPIDESK